MKYYIYETLIYFPVENVGKLLKDLDKISELLHIISSQNFYCAMIH